MKLIICLIICLIPLVDTFGQIDSLSNFYVENNSIIWQKKYSNYDNKEDKKLKLLLKFEDIDKIEIRQSIEKNWIKGYLNNVRLVRKTVLAQDLKATINGSFKISMQNNHYIVSISSIEMSVNHPSLGSSQSSFESMFLGKDKKLGKSAKKSLPDLNDFFTDLFLLK